MRWCLSGKCNHVTSKSRKSSVEHSDCVNARAHSNRQANDLPVGGAAQRGLSVAILAYVIALDSSLDWTY